MYTYMHTHYHSYPTLKVLQPGFEAATPDGEAAPGTVTDYEVWALLLWWLLFFDVYVYVYIYIFTTHIYMYT